MKNTKIVFLAPKYRYTMSIVLFSKCQVIFDVNILRQLTFHILKKFPICITKFYLAESCLENEQNRTKICLLLYYISYTVVPRIEPSGLYLFREVKSGDSIQGGFNLGGGLINFAAKRRNFSRTFTQILLFHGLSISD